MKKKKKGRGPLRGRMYREQGYRSRYRGGPPPRSRLEDRDGDVSMYDTVENPRNRYNSYGRRPPRHGENLSTYDQGRPSNIHVTVRRDMPSQDQRGVDAKELSEKWYRITIPRGRKYDQNDNYEKNWLLSSIQSACSMPFIPVGFHCVNMRADFYVEGKDVAEALQRTSRQIRDKNDHKVIILVRQSGPPFSMQKEIKDLKDDDIVQLKDRSMKIEEPQGSTETQQQGVQEDDDENYAQEAP